MSAFEPIAIVGQGCLLPECPTPEALWRIVVQQRVVLSRAPSDRWRLDRDAFLRAAPGEHSRVPVRSDVGGYVTTPPQQLHLDGWKIDPDLLGQLDPVFQWTIHTVGQALRDARIDLGRIDAARTGLIMGNLSYPTRAFARWHEHVVLGRLPGTTPPPHPFNRFMSGLPAILAARALGLAGPAFCLDAACASALYALKLACDRLHDGSCDLMVTGAVNASDNLFIHAGFSTLRALSQTGRSRPFHREADGLVPSEGAAFVVLKRLADAERAGDTIAGVIRGIGLSNDGRAGGFLSPAKGGQVRAIEAAFAGAGDLSAQQISLVECHATGTAAGDHVEIESMAHVYGRRDDLTVTALKANLGHSITTSAAAGLLKLLGSFKHRVLPPTPNARPMLAELDATGYRVLDEPRPWNDATSPRCAALSAFGMGGNNAHLLLQEWIRPVRRRLRGLAKKPPSPAAQAEIAIVGLAIRTSSTPDVAAFSRALLSGKAEGGNVAPHETTVALDPAQLFSPPNDLRHALGQQLLMLETTAAALTQCAPLDHARTGVFVGMAADPEINRHALRARIGALLQGRVSADWIAAARGSIEQVMEAPDIVGTMPNIPSNRLNHCHNLLGPGFTVSAEEASGNVALELAVAALRRGELDAAIVGAVDLSRETCHERAAAAAIPGVATAADAAVVFVLKRTSDTERTGDSILATLGEAQADDLAFPIGGKFEARFGQAHAATGLLHVAAAALATHQAATLDPGAAELRPVLSGRESLAAKVVVAPFLEGARPTTLTVRRHVSPQSHPATTLPRVCTFAGANRSELAAALRSDAGATAGECRLGFAANTTVEADQLREAALRWLEKGLTTRPPPGIHFHPRPVGGELAFAFTGAAAAYRGMGRELIVGFPELLDGLRGLWRDTESAAGWIYASDQTGPVDPFLQLAGSSFLSQLHARFTQQMLGLRPDAVLGLSSGETNSLFALGIWDDMDGLLDALRDSALYATELAGTFRSVQAHWGEAAPVQWDNWVVAASAEAVRHAIGDEPRAHLTIINSPKNCVIAGDRAACQRVLARLPDVAAVPLGHDLAVHCPVVKPFEPTWRRVHTRPTRVRRDVRVYSNYLGGAYEPTPAAVAEALTGQAIGTIDFPKIVERAWRDGVRIFFEHGPRHHLSSAIAEILGDRPHLVVPLDVAGRPSLYQAADATAALWAAGVGVDLSRWASHRRSEHLGGAPRLTFALRKPPIQLPPWPDGDSAHSNGDAIARTLPRPPVLPATDASEPEMSVPPTAEPAILTLHRELAVTHHHFLQRQSAAHDALLRYQRSFHALLLADRDPVGEPAARGTHTTPAAPRPSTHGLWAVPAPQRPTGPQWNRAELEVLASGKISTVFGPRFEAQDGYAVQVRMPEPPLLLCDRVTGISGEPGSMGKGTVWTETDVRDDSWYLHHGRMPAGIFIEAGQADLLLISWLGADFLNRGARAYRLLGCELVFRGELPQPGDTLRYEIHVDGHARQGDVRLFFFHYDCWINGHARISVRHGQAGFFTPQELADSGGVIWSAAEATYAPDGRVDLPAVRCAARQFRAEQVAAFAAGDLTACFGRGFAATQYHSRTPTIQAGERNLIGAIAAFEPEGGPAGRGYLRAVRALSPDDWFFRGHFKNDPCMPGTLMAEGCLQAMAFYLAALGFTLDRDGWRFEPLPETAYKFVCRGQATPASRELVYELFVDSVSVVAGQPTLVAHVLCTVDGLKAFNCERLALRLVRDFPLSSISPAALRMSDERPVARIGDLVLDHRSLLACAQGDPVEAFGPTFAPYRQAGRSPRLPSPPYHFCTRVTRVDGAIGAMAAGGAIEMLYDIPADAWYLAENHQRTMPVCVLLETALQPCGWLASYVLDPANASWSPSYRNLDGTARLRRDIVPDDGTIVTRVKLTSFAKSGQQVIVRFEVECRVREEPVFTCRTSFGFFTPAALSDTKGIAPTAEEQQLFAQPPASGRTLADAHAYYANKYGFTLPGPRLLRLDRVAGIWPKGGRRGLGYARGDKAVRPDDWVFKAHFFQDPVQPGSIGVESVLLLLKLFALETETRPADAVPVFETIADHEFEWHYRGQVLPHHTQATADCEVIERIAHADGVTLVADGRLWVDGKKIYHLPRMGVRLRWTRATLQVSPTPSSPLVQRIDTTFLRERFVAKVGARGMVLQDLLLGALRQFVDAIVFEDHAGYAALRAKPVLYLANHQVAIESMLFIALADALNDVSCRAIAKHEHRESWMGALDRLIATEIGRRSLLLFDRTNQGDLLARLQEFTGSASQPPCSLLAHVQGTRALRAGEPVTRLSAVFLDLAIRCRMPIVPVRFAGGLPRAGASARLEVPVGFGAQRYYLGRAIDPDELAGVTLRERTQRVRDAINQLGPPLHEETETPADTKFAATVATLRGEARMSPIAAVLIAALQALPDRRAESTALLDVLAGRAAPNSQRAAFTPLLELLRAAT